MYTVNALVQYILSDPYVVVHLLGLGAVSARWTVHHAASTAWYAPGDMENKKMLLVPIVYNFGRKGEPMMSFAAFQPSDLHFAER